MLHQHNSNPETSAFQVDATADSQPDSVITPHSVTEVYPGIFFGRGSRNSAEDRGQGNGDLGAVAP
jgi:hypothetical protein